MDTMTYLTHKVTWIQIGPQILTLGKMDMI